MILFKKKSDTTCFNRAFLIFLHLCKRYKFIHLKQIKTALISVFYKDRLDEIVLLLKQHNVQIYATGGTYDFVKALDEKTEAIENLTGYPSILGGRVKTLHPKVFGGILGRTALDSDKSEMQQYEIPSFDLVIVDLYPFEETIQKTEDKQQIIEKIDIGGISLIRAGAKNYTDVLIVPSSNYYDELIQLLKEKEGKTTLEDRLRFATLAFGVSSHYDSAIFNWFNKKQHIDTLRISFEKTNTLRYGENPHQKGCFYGNLEAVFEKLHGKEISYNNLLDLDSGLNLINEFDEPTFAILKHNNACGLASRQTIAQAYADALAGDPVSAFGGVLVCNRSIDEETATLIDSLFFEIIAAPNYDSKALDVLFRKKNRIILRLRGINFPTKQYKSVFNGILEQDKDLKTENAADFRTVTTATPSETEVFDLIFANKIVKHTRSNAIVLAKNKQLIASGVGQTSRVDALKQAIAKAHENNFELQGAVMASDAFFPFSDCVEIAHNAGIQSVVEPGGSVRDQDSIDFCNANGMSMVFTGTRHFKH